ncbi:hypothetical protein Y1Q_0023416 [Alligator mississippiensis]|uniref:Uncharacterized protein n=1 Tax=Alligator mississippiensis TaxID=8496 RepID=A0A151NPZ4_ALLMI|nr:hypothetical protein Y1Q_0023416 [Alligator mississippiensis]
MQACEPISPLFVHPYVSTHTGRGVNETVCSCGHVGEVDPSPLPPSYPKVDVQTCPFPRAQPWDPPQVQLNSSAISLEVHWTELRNLMDGLADLLFACLGDSISHLTMEQED